jgi:hypothetical protein
MNFLESTLPRAAALCFLAICWTCPAAQGANVTVNCGAKKNNSISAALAALVKSGPNTIQISGICNEAVTIDGMDRLTIIGDPTATINDPTPSSDPEVEDTTVIAIWDSDRIVVQGITVNGGATGIGCFWYSVCRLIGVQVHGALGEGVSYARSSGIVGDDTLIENNGGAGLSAVAGSNVLVIPLKTTTVPTIRNNGSGIRVVDGSHLTMAGSIQDNTGTGITAERGSNVRVFGEVTGNGGRGLYLRSSTAAVTGATITGNTTNGVVVANLSFATFTAGNTITSNGSPDIDCASTTAVTIGATSSTNTGGGTTDCVEPAP